MNKWLTVSLRLCRGIGSSTLPPAVPGCTWRLLGPRVLLPVLQDVHEADGDGDGGQRGQGTALMTAQEKKHIQEI